MSLHPSLIICTYKRKKWVEKLLVSISKQTVMPKEIIIIDASPEKISYSIPNSLEVKLIKSEIMQLTYQKNLGLEIATGEVIFFLDDDILLDRYYIEETLKIFNEDAEKEIGAVSGYISNQWGGVSNAPDLFMKVAKLLTIYDGDFSAGSVSPSGVFIELTELQPFSGVKKVDFVPGGCTAFRKEVFENYRPPLAINKYGGEDKAFSRMIANDWEMYVCGNAKLQHFSAGGGARPSYFNHTKNTVKFHRYIQKNYGQLNRSVLRLKCYYIFNAFRMFIISIVMFLSIIKIRKSVKWFMRASGYLVGALSYVDFYFE
jgi:glucosyl-dolichyl phosphate glucuronosyltransferase